MALDPEFKAKWAAALRSGKYLQGQGELHPEPHLYCCLGVACRAMGKRIPSNRQQPVYDWLTALGVPNSVLWTMNDDEHKSFDEIADFIEANL